MPTISIKKLGSSNLYIVPCQVPIEAQCVVLLRSGPLPFGKAIVASEKLTRATLCGNLVITALEVYDWETEVSLDARMISIY